MILIVAFVTRVSLISIRQDFRNLEHAEMWQIAHSLATTGAYADPYGGHTGPSAQQLPLFPLYMALVQWLTQSEVAAQLVMELSAALASSLAYALLPLIAMELGIPLFAGAVAGLLPALLPIQYWIETKGSWEAPFVGLGLALATWCFLWFYRTGGLTSRRSLAIGGIWGALSLLTACAVPVLAGYIGVLFMQVRGKWRTAQYMLIACGMFAVVLSPWVIRNAIALGGFVPLRSNLGLELNVSNHDGARAAFAENAGSGYSVTVHPFNNPTLQARVRELGEIEFSRQQMMEARAWIAAHPRQFLSLCVQRARLFWLPDMNRWWQTALGRIVRVAAFAGLIILLRREFRVGFLFAWLWISFSAIYYFVQIDIRYPYPLWWSQLLLMAVAGTSLVQLFRSRPPGIAIKNISRGHASGHA